MSDESRSQSEYRTRALRGEEKALLQAMLGMANVSDELLSSCAVEEMADGGMGSLRFVHGDDTRPRKYARTVAEAFYVDADGVPVTVAVNIDDEGELYELDFWKVDFSPVERYPTPGELRMAG